MSLFINILFEYNYMEWLTENQNRNDRSEEEQSHLHTHNR